MSLSAFLKNRGLTIDEGFCQQVPQQVEDLIRLGSGPDVRNVMEIGFNAGHSAEVFLQNNPDITLTSFDYGGHNYVMTAKEYIDDTFPDRHRLIFGDSKKTVPAFIKHNPNAKFDVIFIDGGHDYETAKADLENCFHLAHKDTIVIVDDTVFTTGWEATYTIGPTRVWMEGLRQNKVIGINGKDYCSTRGMSWGKYVM